jgi:hypothetical protein
MSGVIETDENAHVYTVWGSVPPEGVRTWRKNVGVTVVTPRAERAIEIAQKVFPGITVHNVIHRSAGRVFVDTERT